MYRNKNKNKLYRIRTNCDMTNTSNNALFRRVEEENKRRRMGRSSVCVPMEVSPIILMSNIHCSQRPPRKANELRCARRHDVSLL